MRALVVAVVAACIGGSAMATDGAQLRQLIERDSPEDRAYVLGFVDASVRALGFTNVFLCPSAGVTHRLRVGLLYDYLVFTPGAATKDGVTVVEEALHKAYGCTGYKTRDQQAREYLEEARRLGRPP